MCLQSITSTRSRPHSIQGFTLIELLVSVSVFIILTGVVVVNYRSFNQRQALQQSVKNVQEALRFAQKKARVGEKPSGCSSPAVLQGYALQANATSNTYQLFAVCSNGSFAVGEVSSLIGGTRFNMGSNINIVYKILAGGVNAPVNLRFRNDTYCYQFAVNDGGEIGEGTFITCP